MAKGQGKGQEWERELSKMLSLWVSEGQNKNVFWRSKASGASSTNRMKVGKRALRGQVGDIALLDPGSKEGQWFLARFAIETKFERPRNMWPGGEGWLVFERYWAKITKEAESAGVTPLMILKSNFREPLLFMPNRVFRRIAVYLGNSALTETYPRYMEQPRIELYLEGLNNITAVYLFKFLEVCKFQHFTLGEEFVKRRPRT